MSLVGGFLTTQNSCYWVTNNDGVDFADRVLCFLSIYLCIVSWDVFTEDLCCSDVSPGLLPFIYAANVTWRHNMMRQFVRTIWLSPHYEPDAADYLKPK